MATLSPDTTVTPQPIRSRRRRWAWITIATVGILSASAFLAIPAIQAGAAKQTEAKITCVSPGNTVIDWLPGQTSFTIDWYVAEGTGFYRTIGIMKGGGKYTMATPPGAVTWRADVAGESHSGTCVIPLP